MFLNLIEGNVLLKLIKSHCFKPIKGWVLNPIQCRIFSKPIEGLFYNVFSNHVEGRVLYYIDKNAQLAWAHEAYDCY